jgi:hypothetical protein
MDIPGSTVATCNYIRQLYNTFQLECVLDLAFNC